MPFNGAGTFNTLSAPDFPAVSGTTIRAAQFNNSIEDICTGLSEVLTLDGQSTLTNNIPLSGFRFTGSGAAVDPADLIRLDQITGSGGSFLLGFIQAGIDAVAYTMQAKARQIMSVADFGVLGDGTDETVGIHKACAAAELAQCELFWPPTVAGYKTQMVTFTTGKCSMRGHNTKIIQTRDASCLQIGGADYTVSAVFFYRPGAHRCRVSGFNFTQDATMNVPAGYTSVSFASPVVVYRSDYIVVEENIFDCLMGRGVQWRGGNFGRISRNFFLNCGLTGSVGFTADAYYGDAVGVAVPFFSPIGMKVSSNVFYGSSAKVQAGNSLHMTGCNEFNVSLNIITSLTDAAQGGIRIYASDFGVSDIAGTVVSRMAGIVDSNQVSGVFLQGLEVLCDSTTGVDVAADLVCTNTVVNGTGIGIKLERFIGGRLLGSHIRVSASPLWVGDSVANSEVTGYYESTTAGTSLKTIFFGSTSELVGINWHHMTVVSSTACEYMMDTTGVAIGLTASTLSNISFIWNSTALGRICQFADCNASFTFKDIVFDVKANGLSNRYIYSIAMVAAGSLDYTEDNVKAISTNATAYTKRGGLVNSGVNISVFNANSGGRDITCTGEVKLVASNFTHDSTSALPLSVSGAARVKINDCHAEQLTAANQILASFVACGKTKISNSSFVANTSNQVVIRATTSGVVEIDNVDVSNSGTGAAYGITGTGLIAGDLGAYAKDATLWTDANRLAATIMAPGTTFWNSSDNFYNSSNSTNWYSPAGAVT